MPIYFRLPNLIDPSSSIPYRARPINVYDTETPRYIRDSISLVGAYFESPQFSFNLITAAEVNYLKAEAVLAGLTSGDANALYRTGIQLAMEQYFSSIIEIAVFTICFTINVSTNTFCKKKSMNNHPFKNSLLQKLIYRFFSKLRQHPEFYNVSYTRKGNKYKKNNHYIF